MSSKPKTLATKVPKLRFPEFRGAQEWENAILGALSEVVRGGSPRPIDGFLTTAADGLNWLKIGDVDKEAKYVTHTAEKVRPEALSKTRVVNPGDLILSNSMSFGRPYILQIKTCIHDGWIAITDIAKKAERDFLYYSITAPSSQSYFVDNAAGSGVQNLNADIIKALPVCFPSPAEQQKIAECLSSVDELMAAQARKVDVLKTHKKGLMQQLFPREGETAPRLRFPEFRDAGNWNVMKLGNVGRVIRGASPRPKGDPRYYGGPVPRLMVQDVTRDGKWVTPRIDSLTNEGAKLSRPCTAGTLTIVCSGTVGVVSFLAVDACIHDGFLALIDIDESIATKDFLYHSLGGLRLQFEEGATHGGVFTNLTTSTIDQFEIKCPKPTEQQRIAACLSSLDALIAAETRKLEALKTHKKGLMQQLFPSLEEGTA